jgi:tetratricopeptide (TPR) repeat protein
MTPEETSSKDSLDHRAALHCFNFGDKFIRGRAWQNAVTWLKQAIKIQPDFYEAYYLLGEAYIELGRLEEAIETLDRAIQLRPDDSTAHFKLGLAYIARHDWNSALGQYRSLRTLDRVVAKQLFDKIVFSFNYEMFDSLFNQIY